MGEVMNCKPGDLAIVIKASVPQNIGKIVRVLCAKESGVSWFIDCDAEYVTRAGRVVRRDPMRDLFAPDAWLKPVSGLPITDDVTNEVTA